MRNMKLREWIVEHFGIREYFKMDLRRKPDSIFGLRIPSNTLYGKTSENRKRIYS